MPRGNDAIYSFGILHHIIHEEEILALCHNLPAVGRELKVAVYVRFDVFNILDDTDVDAVKSHV